MINFTPNLNVLDDVTALLGHNGAGKTSTIAMLTGAYAPTSGGASVCGRDIKAQMSDIRKDLGICMQHDCLFSQLTVREHVQFFSRLKGLYHRLPWSEAEDHIDRVLADVALFDKRNALSRNLSGGMKRKLSVAVAFCGDSKVVLLDEPTSGMDPFSRRFTWNVIRQYRQNRCIILTTHFMDEADVLGDRIAIMSEGRLQCVGSPLFLKKRYGVGYQLSIEKRHAKRGSSHGSSHGKVPSSDQQNALDGKLRDIVKNSVPDSHMLNNVGTEMTFQLPLGAASQFGPMFDGLDQEMDKGTVSTYGVGITTMEEVFLMVSRGAGDIGERHSYQIPKDSLPEIAQRTIGVGEEPTEGSIRSIRSRLELDNRNLLLRHVAALFKKRAANFSRDKRAWCCTTILPTVFVLLGFIVFRFASPERSLSPLFLTLDDYNQEITEGPRNPLVFNEASAAYTCQPGSCAYPFGDLDFSLFTAEDERYFLCGTEAKLDPEKCSIDGTDGILRSVDGEDGLALVAATLGNVSEVSPLLCLDVLVRCILRQLLRIRNFVSLPCSCMTRENHSSPVNTVQSSSPMRSRV
jgi:ATP-binding cassette, subfamily A (ABC1), member 3